MKKTTMSFQLRLYIYILVITMFVFGSIVALFATYNHKQEEEQAALYTFALQNATVLNLEDELEWMESSVELTIRQVLSIPPAEHDKALEFIGQLVQNNYLILGVGYVACADGDFTTAPVDYLYEDSLGDIHYNRVPLSEYNYTQAQWFKSAVDHGKGEWTEPYMDRSGSHKPIVSYALPVRDSLDHIKGVVVADVSLDVLADELSTVKPFKNSYSFILSKKGAVIAHPDSTFRLKETVASLVRFDDDYATVGRKMMAGEKGYLHCEIDDTDVLVCYDQLPHVGWSVASVCPYSTILSEIGSVSFVVIGILVVGIILLLVSIRILLSRMVRPIRHMTDSAYRIAQGDFNASLPEMSANDDFGKLRDAFAHMQQSLKTYISDLESSTKIRERMNGELDVANRIQMEILPTDFMLAQGYEAVDIDAFLCPARKVGGDFYDFCMKDGKLYFAIGDVSGKGIAAAIVMAMTCTLFRTLVTRSDSPRETMALLNETLSRNNHTGMFVTMILGILDVSTGELAYCNAGHTAPYLLSAAEVCAKLPLVAKLPLGLFPGVDYVNQTCVLRKGQTLLLYTDGLTEAENPQKEQMGAQRVERMLATLGGKTSCEVLAEVRHQLNQFVDGAEQSDDLTLFAIGYGVCKTLVVDNNIGQLAKLPAFVNALGDDLRLPKPQVLSLRLALEEALVNVINYAYPKRSHGKISLKATYEPEQSCLRFELTDSGKPFDPTAVPDANLKLSVEDRPVGGLGIFLLRKQMDTVDYKYENGMNKLIMTKTIKR